MRVTLLGKSEGRQSNVPQAAVPGVPGALDLTPAASVFPGILQEKTLTTAGTLGLGQDLDTGSSDGPCQGAPSGQLRHRAKSRKGTQSPLLWTASTSHHIPAGPVKCTTCLLRTAAAAQALELRKNQFRLTCK